MASHSATCWTRRSCTERLGSDGVSLPLEQWPELLLPEDEESLLVRADLMQADVIEPCVDAFPDRSDIGLGIGTDRHVLRRLLKSDRLRRSFEIGRPADLLRELAAEAARRPKLVHEPPRGAGVASPADLYLDVSRFSRAARAVVCGDDLGMRADERAGDACADRELRRRGDRPDHRPNERALPLPVDPRMEVVRQLDVRKAGLLGALRGSDHFQRAVLLAGDPEADLHDRQCCTDRAWACVHRERRKISV